MLKKTLSFKKIAVLAIALLAFSFGVKAQSWYVMGEYIWSPPHPQGTFEELYNQGGDETINGMVYHTVFRQTQTEVELLGAYRQDGEQVYYCKWNGSDYDDEVLLYDYDLEVGDWFNDDDDHPMEVVAVTVITDNNGVQRKKYDFSFIGLENETEFWIEGIGSSKGFVNSGNYTPTEDGAIFHLLCYHVDNDLIYVNPEYNTCDITELDENNAESTVTIYPNPANNVVKIMNTEGMTINKVEVIDVLGRTVISTENTNEINVSSLPEGQYFVRIQGETTLVRKLSISK